MRTPLFPLALLLAALLAGCAGTALSPNVTPGESLPPREDVPRSLPPKLPAPTLPPPPSTPVPPRVQSPSVPPVDAQARERLLHLLPVQVADRAGWATDMGVAFASLRITPTAENICSAIAVIEQESGFQADPVVPGLPTIVRGEIEKRRAKYLIPKMLLEAGLRRPSPDGRSYDARIKALRTEREMNLLFEDMTSELPFGKTLLSGYNPVRTGGPMQVSVEFAEAHVRQKGYPYTRYRGIRDEVFSRRGGLYFGIAILLDYPVPYSQPLFRFADFNAGRYSSRNAAFQAAVAKLSRRKLDLDGDLLRYQRGEASEELSATEAALHGLASRLGLSQAAMRRDLLLEKNPAFADTPLYRQVFARADALENTLAKGPLPRELLPRILLKSPKITRRLTTEWFAKRVDSRYRDCLTRGGPL